MRTSFSKRVAMVIALGLGMAGTGVQAGITVDLDDAGMSISCLFLSMIMGFLQDGMVW